MKITSEELGKKVEEFIAHGGKIKRFRSRADEVAALQIPTGKYWRKSDYIAELTMRKGLSLEEIKSRK